MTDTQTKLDNLTDALVEDILKTPDEEVLLDALADRFAALRDQLTAAQARLNDIRAELPRLVQLAEIAMESHRLERLKAGHKFGTKRLGLYDDEVAQIERWRALSKDTPPPKQLEVNMAQAVNDGAFSGLSFGLSAALGRHDT